MQALQFLSVTSGRSRLSLSVLLASPSPVLAYIKLEPLIFSLPRDLSDLSSAGGHSETLLPGEAVPSLAPLLCAEWDPCLCPRCALCL